MTAMVDGTKTSAAAPKRPRTALKAVAAMALLGVVAAGAGIYWFLRDDAPDAVTLEAATAAVADDAAPTTRATDAASAPSAASPAGTATSAPVAAGSAVAGTWQVDTSVGTFDFENSTGTFVGFRVEEELSGIGSTTAVGRTPQVAGTLVIDGTTVTAVDITADMTVLVTNESRRDSRARSALGTSEFPTATFRLTAPLELGTAAAKGEAVSVTATGDLTIKGVTKSVQFPLQAQLTNGTIVVVGSLDIVFADYGVQVPTAPVVVSAEDHGPIELQLFFARS